MFQQQNEDNKVEY